MGNYLTNQQLYGLIILVIYSFIKSISHFVLILNPFNFTDKQMAIYTNWQLHFSDVINIIFIIFSLYLLFIKNIKSFTYLMVCLLLLFKGMLHFVTDYKIYKYFGFDKNTQNKIENFHSKFANLSDLLIGIISFYFLLRIFMG